MTMPMVSPCRSLRFRLTRTLLVSLAALLGLAGIAVAASGPGSPSQVAALVRAAPRITTLPVSLRGSVATASGDTALVATPSLARCITGGTTLPACVFGDPQGKRTMVLYGDSHALMWFPAVDAIAKSRHWRLIALIELGCPFADLSVWGVTTNAPYSNCPIFRANMISRIDALDPNLVVLAESYYYLDGQDRAISTAEWGTAVEATLGALHSASMKKVLIGDTISVPSPDTCLAAFPTSIQSCSIAESNPQYAGQRNADIVAAKAADVLYVNDIPWTCSSVCTAVVGQMLVYNSTGHISATYATYLTRVLSLALAPSM